ncbi:MAG: putative solute:sodium symporter small subunit [Candidatus Accumulibacter sp. BA-94]|uniref:DUF4212 domain-containing protein n=1 Tax=Accumulibacter sp. TaxID=2053492 RepID=UPI00044FC4E4|nr:DUF4212 domain-containing protein [Accumulibacter sp.]EXI91586.1 MAG: putative solute:sodium symporter small subunit [Candidatus Accumulibacter sp. BA-94]MBL8391151.1 DUF4212 domain-containing protein [Accumulibacter sp.]HRD86858.1 DUF4212 domain-containing protein [Accumulibacter sp.]
MQLDDRQRAYWRRNLRLTAWLLGVWFFVSFVISYFAREVEHLLVLDIPFGFYMGAQGAPLIYLLIVWWYARRMDGLDHDYGVQDTDGEE